MITDPEETNKDSYRVIRGVSWGIDGRICLSAFRFRNALTYRDDYSGVRIIMNVTNMKALMEINNDH